MESPMSANGSAGTPTLATQKAGPPTRRRGSKLETALLQAAWDELTEAGYAAFTMEGVAARAKTSRAVLYRRWPNRPQLVLAALARRMELTPFEPPDTGSLREDLLALLRHMSAGVGEVTGVLSFLIANSFTEAGVSPADLRQRALAEVSISGTAQVIDRAIARGEIDRTRLSPRIRSLPVDLVRHDVIMTQQPVPDATLVEIVDRIFLPLVRG
jgi:AcrR family transcriptional regulator